MTNAEADAIRAAGQRYADERLRAALDEFYARGIFPSEAWQDDFADAARAGYVVDAYRRRSAAIGARLP